jgi:hypothetical protein
MNLLFIITNFAPNFYILTSNNLLTHKTFKYINNTILLIKNIFKWNIISLKLNGENPYNLYFFIFILIGVLSSLIIRSSFISLDMLNSNNEIIIMIIKLLFLFTILYAIKLILDILKRGIQAFKIIPDFIYWYRQDVKDIKQIITSYYILNLLLILLSSYILYHIIIKLNVFIENIYLYIIVGGILSSFVFFNYYPINKFYLNTNVKEYSLFIYLLFILFIYLLFILFILFYLFILPFIFIKVINNDKLLTFKNDFIKQCYDNTDFNYMSSQNSGRRVINNLNNNTISVPDNNNLELSNNLSNNQVIVRNNTQVNLTVNHHNYSLASNAHVQSQSQSNPLLNQSNNASTSSQTQQNNNLLSPPEYNASNSSNASNQSLEQ